VPRETVVPMTFLEPVGTGIDRGIFS
jgi:hypothetical protein